MARPDRPEHAAFMIAADDEATFTIVDASERYASGRALRAARTLADRTQKRLQLVIDSSIAFAQAGTEERLAEILATTAAQAYRAEEATVYLADERRQLWRAAGWNSFEELSDLGAAAESVLGLREVIKVSGEDEGGALSPRLEEMMRTTGVQSLIAAPLHLDSEVLGIFFCFFHHPRQFDEEATPLAEALAGQAAQALTSVRLQQRLEYAAMHDETTGLPNRRRLEAGIAGLDEGKGLAVMFIDLDGFKSVNDYLGHQQGDEVLREAARRLQSTVREDDLVIRYGGDEFVVVCEVRDDIPVSDVADRLRDVLQSPYPALPAGLTISASIGVATSATEHRSASIDRIIRMADQAMYEAKVGGGNRVVGA
ncbi:MAG TPA: GGDEF domain-containing protein [Galbitalea sp.]